MVPSDTDVGRALCTNWVLYSKSGTYWSIAEHILGTGRQRKGDMEDSTCLPVSKPGIGCDTLLPPLLCL